MHDKSILLQYGYLILANFSQMSAMVKRLAYEDEKLTESLLNELLSKFAKSSKWVGRQT